MAGVKGMKRKVVQERGQPMTLGRLLVIADIMRARIEEYANEPALVETYTLCLNAVNDLIRRRLSEAKPDPS